MNRYFLLFLLLVPIYGQTAPSQSADQNSTQKAAASIVRGRVIYADNSQPVKGTRVEVVRANDDESGRRWTAHTNNNGEFRLENLPAGKYYALVIGPGVPTPSGFGMRIPVPLTAIPRREDYPEIVPRHDVAFSVDGSNSIDVEIRVNRGGSVSGKVMKPNGSPVADVAVNLISRRIATGPDTARFSTRTNQKGVFKFENVWAGDYVVSAAVEDNKSNFDIRARMRGESQVVTYHPAALKLADALTVKVDPGRESSGVNVTLIDRPTLSASGILIRSRDGSPLAGAIVVLRNKDAELTGPLMPGNSERRTETTSDGKWSFSNLSPGDYEVTALAPAVPGQPTMGQVARPPSPRMGPPAMVRMNPGPRPRYLISQRQLTLVSNNVENLTLTIGGAGRIRGIVEVENNQPVPGNLTLFFEFFNEGMRPGRPEPVRVQADGSFVLDHVPSGDRRMLAGLPQDSPFYVASISLNDKELSETPVSVVEDGEVGLVKVLLSSRFATISGTVAEASRSGEVVVLAVPIEASKYRFRIVITAVRVGADGSFSAKVAPGKYLVVARSGEGLPLGIGPEQLQALSEMGQTVSLSPDEHKTVQLRVAQR